MTGPFGRASSGAVIRRASQRRFAVRAVWDEREGEGVVCRVSAARVRDLPTDRVGTCLAINSMQLRGVLEAYPRLLRLGIFGTSSAYEGRSNLTPSDLQVLMGSPYLSSELTLELDGHALELVADYRLRSGRRIRGSSESEPTGPITKRFRIMVRGQP